MLVGKTNRYESDTSELGLALAYDIVKAHGGEIRVETKGAREVSLLFSCQFDDTSKRVTFAFKARPTKIASTPAKSSKS